MDKGGSLKDKIKRYNQANGMPPEIFPKDNYLRYWSLGAWKNQNIRSGFKYSKVLPREG